jgi:hypothetical protein
MFNAFMPFLWVAVALIILVLLQRWIHTHLHGLSLLLTGKPDRAIYMYAIILFPGVLLHELSHWVTARVLGVRTGGFSIIPQRRADGSIQLGYVEYYKSRTLDPIRESLIGGAPLIVGTLVILLISLKIFNVTNLAAAVETGQVDAVSIALADFFSTPFVLLWIYLIFAISNGMLPSASDRRSWPAFIVAMIILAAFVYLLGLQEEVANGLAGPVATIFGYLGIAFSVAIGTDILFMLILTSLEAIVSRIKGVNVVYGPSDSGD